VDKLRELTRNRKRAYTWYQSHGSKGYQAVIDLEAAAYADGALSGKEKELIAVGIAVVVNCESCMQWHIEQAAKRGATLNEVVEAIDVGIEMGGGPATVAARFAMDVMIDVFED